VRLLRERHFWLMHIAFCCAYAGPAPASSSSFLLKDALCSAIYSRACGGGLMAGGVLVTRHWRGLAALPRNAAATHLESSRAMASIFSIHPAPKQHSGCNPPPPIICTSMVFHFSLTLHRQSYLTSHFFLLLYAHAHFAYPLCLYLCLLCYPFSATPEHVRLQEAGRALWRGHGR